VAATRPGDDQLLAAVVAGKPVVSERHVGRETVDVAQSRPVLEGDLADSRQRRPGPGHGDEAAVRRLLVRPQSHRGQHRRAHLGRDRPALAEGVDV
jgi:hypothetical protein